MAQNILTVDMQKFVNEIHRVETRNLVRLLEGVYEFKWEIRDKISDDQIMDLERKETKIWAELQRRGYLTDKDNKDFHEWLNKINYRRSLW